MTTQSYSLKKLTNGNSLRLLVVDDDDVDRERMRRLLAKLKVQSTVIEACSLCEACQCLNDSEFDCIFLDYHLGDSLGTDLLNQACFMSKENLPVILVTGQGSERLAVEAMHDGAYDYIPKTQLREDLLETVLSSSLQRASLEKELKFQRDRLEHLSMYDMLTGLPNRALFFDRLNQVLQTAQRNERTFAVMQIDLDLFKEINDQFGHAAGDMVLNIAGQRMEQVLRTSDSVARIGGDEFSVLLIDTDSAQAALNVAEKIRAAIQEPILIADKVAQIGASIGIALFPEHADNVDALLANADRAMYAAKRAGGTAMVYGREMDDLRPRAQIDTCRLQQAIDNKELFLEFQPLIDLASRKIVGAEALVRWRLPNRDVIPPAAFIPLAERSPVIGPLSYAIIDMGLDQAVEWQNQNLAIPLSINLSARMLEDFRLPEKILAALAKRNLKPSILTLEITETAVMSNIDQARKILGKLSSSGISISIDDFGAGFTSFKYLRELEIAEIKIDMAFTRDMAGGSRNTIIVHSIAMLADGFGIPSVAEGIEDIRSCETLLGLGCRIGQGYGIARPMAAPAFNAWRHTWTLQNAAVTTRH